MVTKTTGRKFKKSTRPHIIVLHYDNKLSYHYIEDPRDESKLVGDIIGRYETSHYLKNEKEIQEFHKNQIKGE